MTTQTLGDRIKERRKVPEIICPQCHQVATKSTSAVNRAKEIGAPIYCGRKCMGLASRMGKTKTRLVEEKRLYDAEYRVKNEDMLRSKKKEYFQRTYDPEAAAVYRKGRMHLHVEYCRTPEYREKKKAYDREHRAKENYGEFWESFLLSQDIEKEALSITTRYEIMKENGLLNKATRRKRNHE